MLTILNVLDELEQPTRSPQAQCCFNLAVKVIHKGFLDYCYWLLATVHNETSGDVAKYWVDVKTTDAWFRRDFYGSFSWYCKTYGFDLAKYRSAVDYLYDNREDLILLTSIKERINLQIRDRHESPTSLDESLEVAQSVRFLQAVK